MSGRRVAGAIRSLVNARDLQLEFARVLHETLIVPVLMYGSETMLWKENGRFRERAVQMDNFAGFEGVGRMNRVLNARIREACGEKNGLDQWLATGGSQPHRGARSLGRGVA